MNQELGNLLSKKLESESINGEIINLEPLTGGASKEIWKFEVKLKDKSETVSYTHLTLPTNREV